MKTNSLKKLHTKSIAILITVMLAANLAACGKVETVPLTMGDYELNFSDGIATSKGIHIGSTTEEFLDAYAGYDLEISIGGGAYEAFDADKTPVPFTDSVQTILPTFFIDDAAMTIEQICTENEIERTELLSLLSSEEYLAEHEVSYYYMIFSWENGAVADISTEYMDYNEDAAYYNEIS